MQTLDDMFGVGPSEIVASHDLTTVPYATTEQQNEPPPNAARALLDPNGSAIFWVALAALLGLILVSGQLKVSAALRARGGR